MPLRDWPRCALLRVWRFSGGNPSRWGRKCGKIVQEGDDDDDDDDDFGGGRKQWTVNDMTVMNRAGDANVASDAEVVLVVVVLHSKVSCVCDPSVPLGFHFLPVPFLFSCHALGLLLNSPCVTDMVNWRLSSGTRMIHSREGERSSSSLWLSLVAFGGSVACLRHLDHCTGVADGLHWLITRQQ